MVRLTDEQADRIALSLLYIKNCYPATNFSTVWREMWRQYREEVNSDFPPPYLEEVTTMLEERHEDRNLSGLFVQDVESLMQSVSGAHTPADITLIERLVDIIKRPFTRNIITVSMLNDIRQALLIPEERAGLAETLQAREYHCGNCNRLLHSGEMATLIGNPGGNPTLTCSSCHPAIKMACAAPGCNEGVMIDKRTLGVLNKPHVCPTHAENTAAEVPETPSFRVPSIFSRLERPVGPPNVSAPGPMGNAERQRQLRDLERALQNVDISVGQRRHLEMMRDDIRHQNEVNR